RGRGLRRRSRRGLRHLNALPSAFTASSPRAAAVAEFLAPVGRLQHGLEDPQHVADVDADVARAVGVPAEVAGDVLEHAVEVEADQPAAAVDDRRTAVAAGGVAVEQE